MRNSLTLAFTLLLVLLCVNYYYTSQTLEVLMKEQQRIEEEQGVRLEILAWLKLQVDAETGQRGYLLTGDEKYLEPYKHARNLLNQKDVKLRSLMAPLEEIQQIRERIDTAGKSKLDELERTISVRRELGLEAALKLVKTDEGKHYMDSIRTTLEGIDEAKRDHTRVLRREADERRKSSTVLNTVSSLVIGIAFLGLFVLTMRHISERNGLIKKARDVSEELKKALASERAAHSEATHANKLKDEFIAVVSHELRTPLNAILGWTSLLREEAEDKKELDEGLDTIDRNARAQAKLVDDLLDVSRIVSGKVRLQISEVRLKTIVAGVADGLRPAAEARGVRVTLNCTPESTEVLGDADRLQQIVWNLLTNAIKFTPRGGSVSISLEHENSRIILQVKDNGQGINPTFLPRIFDRFSQQETGSTRGQAGLGLGLSITRHLVELHGGKLTAMSDGLGMGATFRVEIPVVAVRELSTQLSDRTGDSLNDATSPLAAQPDRNGLKGVHVMALDDQVDTLAVIRRVLGRAGAEVYVVTSVDEALKALESWKPDVIISDIGMPAQDGYSFIAKLRENTDASLRSLPVIALTAFAREADRKQAIDAGFTDHLAKPVDALKLLGKVIELYEKAGNRPENT